MLKKLENFVPGIYIGEATSDGGLILHLVKEADKIANPRRNPMSPLPFSESGFCSQEQIENYNKQVYA